MRLGRSGSAGDGGGGLTPAPPDRAHRVSLCPGLPCVLPLSRVCPTTPSGAQTPPGGPDGIGRLVSERNPTPEQESTHRLYVGFVSTVSFTEGSRRVGSTGRNEPSGLSALRQQPVPPAHRLERGQAGRFCSRLHALPVSEEAVLLDVGGLSTEVTEEIGPRPSHRPASYSRLVHTVTGRVPRKNAGVQAFFFFFFFAI